MDVPPSLRCAFPVEQLVVCCFDNIHRLRGLNSMIHIVNQNSIDQIHEFITNGTEFHFAFLRYGILQLIRFLLHPPRPENSGKASSILLLLTNKSFKLFASSLDKALFNELVELMFSPQAIVRNNASEIIEALAEGRGLDEEGEGEEKREG
ncbi:uncharacterized protein MONOS_11885 [Monocercomonoides exilis]|uniref:uncharacterized protein n=1 Tax=Monocercomonoides exilis TaxID=2049356 RepID=UPI00355AA623|nr:hypothetical protein MONOS_11885 [Monocercomonoides exilis]|eukprot:MONOS_11885.1-p1 / transcript=MONOS_11885.1 / gene=MONOS_11885 / organism=Monocercomonoides_exilis_PA203 / gene_product=unspecified product / transcript_product=unspecified product / location=Mono_scaffold00621:34970-35841(+) / protein_length=151 / sequence_SO=supercontig / SO=protein_coding / is_pseudo=false